MKDGGGAEEVNKVEEVGSVEEEDGEFSGRPEDVRIGSVRRALKDEDVDRREELDKVGKVASAVLEKREEAERCQLIPSSGREQRRSHRGTSVKVISTEVKLTNVG